MSPPPQPQLQPQPQPKQQESEKEKEKEKEQPQQEEAVPDYDYIEYATTSPISTTSTPDHHHHHHEKEKVHTIIAQQEGEESPLYALFQTKTPEWHSQETNRLLRKVDLHLLPLLILMYLLNFLDRSNLAQARLGSLEEDLNMQGTDFNLATIAFEFGAYEDEAVGFFGGGYGGLIFFGPSGGGEEEEEEKEEMGAISAAQGSVHNFVGLVMCRFFLGFVEAPFFPGAIMLMSSWYTRKELAYRIAWFYSGSSLANAFGGLIAAGVLGNLEGAHGIAGWRWLFIIEGSITVGVALVAAMILPNFPANTKWLDETQRKYAQWRLIQDTGEADELRSTTLWTGAKLALKDPRVYVFVLLQHTSILAQNFQYFFPTIVKTLGYPNIETLLVTAPVWMATFLVSLLVTWTSGKTGDRSIHIMCLMTISCVGCIICVATTVVGARFFAMFLMPMGAVSAYQIIVAWVANSFPRPLVKRSACIAIANMIANTASIYGSYMWPSSDSPRYIPGGAATAVLTVLVAVETFALRVWHIRINKRLEEQETLDEEGHVVNLHADDPDARAVGFRYIY
ncbi:MAG: hypothetical protein M1834_000901 [Cirrosporium novae-zelandiae]|nr:MAG: hypothetical protein M1834_000901 [Cirrosporium novae-zelandiae]